MTTQTTKKKHRPTKLAHGQRLACSYLSPLTVSLTSHLCLPWLTYCLRLTVLSLSLSLHGSLAPSQAFLRTWSQLAHFPAAFCADEQGDSQRAILFTALSSYPAEQREQSAARRNQTESWLLTRPRHSLLTHPPNRHCRAFHTAGTKLEPIIMTWIAALAQAVKATPVRAGLHRQLPARLLALNADIATLAGLFGDAMQ